MQIKTRWITELYDPSKPPPPPPELEPVDQDAVMVLTAMQAGKLTCPAIAMYYGRDRHAIRRAMNRLIKSGQVIAIGQGGAKRYLLNQDWRKAA